MRSRHVIGRALLKTTLTPAQEGDTVDAELASQLQTFLILLEKAYLCAAEEKFDRFLKVFSEEVHDYLDERYLGQALDDLPSNTPGEMEEFMEKMAKRKKKK